MKRDVIIKRGTDYWWTWVIMLHVAHEERKRLGLKPSATVTIRLEQCNIYVKKLNRNPLRRLWLLFTIGDVHQCDRDKIGETVAIEDDDGTVHEFFRKAGGK